MSRVLEPFECDCSCHGAGGTITPIHNGPCCEECPDCGKRIIIGYLDQHQEKHCHITRGFD